MKRIEIAGIALAMTLGVSAALAKIPAPPPAPPLDDKAKAAAEEKKAKDAVSAEKAKAEQAAAEDKAVKNFQGNMKKMGKPIPKPTPVAAATPPQLMPGPAKAGTSSQGHEKGAMTPAGNTPPKGNDTPVDAKKK
ncbi:MAG TPA: hypothetical protein VII36_07695 [Usitatibacter sp.]